MNDGFDFNNPEHAKLLSYRSADIDESQLIKASVITGNGSREERLARLMQYQKDIKRAHEYLALINDLCDDELDIVEQLVKLQQEA